jgi:hypothetical protein
VAHVPLARGSEYFEGLAWSAAVAENLPVDTVRERLEAFLVNAMRPISSATICE